MRGQTSFEYLFIVILVITATIWLISYYLPIHDTTIAYLTTKDYLTKEMNKKNLNGIISRIDATTTRCENCIDLNVKIKSNYGLLSTLDLNETKEKIRETTRFKDIQIFIIRD